ncbi:MAG: hypothetical protein IJZ82_07230 [Lachnospiraceae bacterium]|nr:hypothetical protein [Lachnospiraceae bacterium]
MDVFKKIMNVLGIFLAIIVSLVLAVVLIATPVVSGAASFFEAENLSKIVRSLDFNELLLGNGQLEQQLGEYGPLLDAISETAVLEDVVDLYVEDVMNALEGSGEKHLTVEAVKEIMVAHMDEIMPIVKSQMGDVASLLPEEEIEKYVVTYLESYGDTIINKLPSIEDLGLSEDVLMGVRLLGEGRIVTVLVIAIAVLSVLILLLRWVHFKGFMWLGVDYLISALVVFLASFGIGGAGALLVSVAGSMAELVAEPILSVLSAAMFKGAGICAGLAVLFIIIYVVGRKLFMKKA